MISSCTWDVYCFSGWSLCHAPLSCWHFIWVVKPATWRIWSVVTGWKSFDFKGLCHWNKKTLDVNHLILKGGNKLLLLLGEPLLDDRIVRRRLPSGGSHWALEGGHGRTWVRVKARAADRVKGRFQLFSMTEVLNKMALFTIIYLFEWSTAENIVGTGGSSQAQ